MKWTKGIASFFIVGLGQLIKGEERKALDFILWCYFIFPALLYVSLLLNAYLFLLVLAIAAVWYPIFWIYNIWDALK